jgi:RNA polymerase sigma-70 factor, ECF subfamily
MFIFLVSGGILLVQAIQSKIEAHPQEKVRVSMTVDKSAQQQETREVDAQALTRLYEQFRRPIHSYTYRLLGSQEDADDITQEVFIRAFTAWDGLYERDRLSSWLYRIATNLCVDLLRRRKRVSWWPLSPRLRRTDATADDQVPDDLASFLADSGGIPEVAERELIRMVLSAMPVDYSTVLILSAAQGLTYQEIAGIVGISPNAAATRITRAKKMFAVHYQNISKDGVGAQE